MIAYIPGWKTPPPASEIASSGYTHVIVAFGLFSTKNPGEIVASFDSITVDDIKAMQQASIKVLLAIGGASSNLPNTTVDFHQALSLASSPLIFSHTMNQSLNDFIMRYGFDGFDFDIEHGLLAEGTFEQPTGDIATLAGIINALHVTNPTLLLTLAPQTANIAATSGFDETWGNYASLIMQTHQSLTWVGIQLYNAGCTYGIDHVCYDPNNAQSPDASVAMVVDLLENWPSKTERGIATGFQPYTSYLTPSQIALGYPVQNANGISDGAPSAVSSTIKRALNCLHTGVASTTSCDTYVPPRAYATMGGVFAWEITYDADNHYDFVISLKNCVTHQMCD
jgi:chitinase